MGRNTKKTGNSQLMTTLFLDLEKTMIHSWDDPIIVNEERIMSSIRLVNPDKVGIYSYAIYDKKDLTIFQDTIQYELEKSFQINIDPSLVFTVEEIAETIKQTKNADVRKFIQEYSKQKSFYEFIKNKYRNGKFILIDDLVDNSEVFLGDLNIQFLNPFLSMSY
ncbi:MAG TPA: hypothetical protein PK079_24860 [Leptospiraceae bacterium]|nr:hypothetical protein [Leptospiraceae bacterium]HMW08682.1 hypothetical protein [Leptospiraceae bacterium]HMX34935.1 hypothetical protein [Leptospiraceae bacterium]HMY34395.1 hypothetical protein [Leptospiraceae bacterium]HMZ67200.1 hypothetical protein [Leptospiraceae bacterium]